MNKNIETAAKVIVGVSAVSVALAKFIGFDLISKVPAGIISTVVVAAVGASGALVLYLLYKKQI